MDEPQEDDLLRERAFQRGGGLDLSGFVLNVEQAPEPEEEETTEATQIDAAIGEIASPFGESTSSDGPTDDVVTGLAVDGERRVGEVVEARLSGSRCALDPRRPHGL